MEYYSVTLKVLLVSAVFFSSSLH